MIIRACQLLTISLLLSLIACGGNKVLISQADIERATQTGQLQGLWQKADRLAKESSGSSKKQALALRSQISAILVKQQLNKIDEAFKQASESEIKRIPRSEIKSLQRQIADMRLWDAEAFAQQSRRLNSALDATEESIKEAVQKANQEGISLLDKVRWLRRAAELAGKGEAEFVQYQRVFKEVTEHLLNEGRNALNKKMYGTAKKLAEQGLQIDSGNLQFESLLEQAEIGLFEQDFRFALENAKSETAYNLLIEVAGKPLFAQIRTKLQRNINLLANFFAGNARAAYQRGDWLTAYRDFKRGRHVQELLGLANKGFVQERGFIDLLMKKARDSKLTAGRRYALLNIVKEFDANTPGLDNLLAKSEQAIRARALTKLKISSFKEIMTSNSLYASVGRRIASQLEKQLFSSLGNEVMVVAQIPQKTPGGYDGQVLAVDGQMLQAAIETRTSQGRRAKTVQTGVRKVETEAYKQWKKRKKGVAPRQYDEIPITEEIELTVTHIKKISIAEVAFRIIEPSSGKILLTDTLIKQAEYQGESINEYQKGTFHQPFVEADLPSDIAIMDELSKQLALALAEKLSAFLSKPEVNFYESAKQAKKQGLPLRALEYLANANVISTAKNASNDQWYREMVQLALKLK